MQAEAATVLQAAVRGWAVRGAVGGAGLRLLRSVAVAEEGRLAVARRELRDEAVALEREAAVREARLSLDREREALAEERLAGGHCAIKRQYLSKRARKQL